MCDDVEQALKSSGVKHFGWSMFPSAHSAGLTFWCDTNIPQDGSETTLAEQLQDGPEPEWP